MIRLNKEQAVNYVMTSKKRTSVFKLGKITKYDARIVAEAAKSFGFEVKSKLGNAGGGLKKAEYAAAFYCTGPFTLSDEAVVETDIGKELVKTIVFQRTVEDEKNRQLAKSLIENEQASLYDGLGSEYLQFALNEVSDNLFYEDLKDLAKGIPIYHVTFKDDGGFDVKDVGAV